MVIKRRLSSGNINEDDDNSSEIPQSGFTSPPQTSPAPYSESEDEEIREDELPQEDEDDEGEDLFDQRMMRFLYN
jgi:hypothetical protein